MNNVVEFKAVENWTSHFLPFPLQRMRIRVEREDAPIPSLIFRGRFGCQLLKQFCSCPARASTHHNTESPHSPDCLYTLLFKPAPLSEPCRPDAPPPIVFNTYCLRGQHYLEITTFVTDTFLLKTIASVLQHLGSGEVQYEQQVEGRDWRPELPKDVSENGLSIPPAPEKISIQFLTPTRLRKGGRWISASQLEAPDFLYALYRRHKSLSYQYGTPLNWDMKHLAEDTRDFQFDEKHLYWSDARRSNAKKVVEHSGVVGMATLSRDLYEEYWSIIWAGQFINIGKGAAHGLGRYQVSVVTSL